MNTAEVSWTRYSAAYDVMAANNPAYQEIVHSCLMTAGGWSLHPGARVLDAGAGTGNFSIPLAQALPQCTVIHLEPDPGMCGAARAKAARAGVGNLEFLQCDLSTANFVPGSMCGIVSVHMLYAVPDPHGAIQLLASWLAPSGRLFACDAGRRVRVGDWTRYILTETSRRHGWLAAARVLWNGHVAASENRRISRMQDAGRFWLHNSSEFREEFERAGLIVEDVSKCYRGCSDLVLCRKPAL